MTTKKKIVETLSEDRAFPVKHEVARGDVEGLVGEPGERPLAEVVGRREERQAHALGEDALGWG